MLLEVYTKPGCPLCDEMIELVEEARVAHDFTLVLRNIFEQQAWFEAYRHRIPVVAIDGAEVLELRFTPAALEAALTARRPAS